MDTTINYSEFIDLYYNTNAKQTNVKIKYYERILKKIKIEDSILTKNDSAKILSNLTIDTIDNIIYFLETQKPSNVPYIINYNKLKESKIQLLKYELLISKNIQYNKSKLKQISLLVQKSEYLSRRLVGNKYYQQIFINNKFFESIKNKNNILKNSINEISIEELEKLGYQTKRRVLASVATDFNTNNSDSLFQNMESDFIETSNLLINNKYTSSIKDLKRIKGNLINIPEFNLNSMKLFTNSMRSIPFKYRFEYDYSFQFIKPNFDNRPASLTFYTTALYKILPNMNAGFGGSVIIGLGNGWRNINIDFQGFSINTTIQYRLIKDIHVQATYENKFNTGDLSPVENDDIRKYFPNNQIMIYAGLINKYRINEKIKGNFFIGYDFLSHNYNYANPWVIKIGFSR